MMRKLLLVAILPVLVGIAALATDWAPWEWIGPWGNGWEVTDSAVVAWNLEKPASACPQHLEVLVLGILGNAALAPTWSPWKWITPWNTDWETDVATVVASAWIYGEPTRNATQSIEWWKWSGWQRWGPVA